jgi:cytochrome c-type biogenesis protein CcmE
LELTPRTLPDPATSPPRRQRNPWAYGALVAVLLGLGVVVYQGLTSASLYFYNADEAVAQRDELGDRRFRLQGTVLGGSVERTGDGVEFAVAYDGVRVDVHHDGDPPELFEPGIPVVLEGSWAADGRHFASDRILVKHSEQYEEDNGERLEEAEREGETGSQAP